MGNYSSQFDYKLSYEKYCDIEVNYTTYSLNLKILQNSVIVAEKDEYYIESKDLKEIFKTDENNLILNFNGAYLKFNIDVDTFNTELEQIIKLTH